MSCWPVVHGEQLAGGDQTSTSPAILKKSSVPCKAYFRSVPKNKKSTILKGWGENVLTSGLQTGWPNRVKIP